MGTSWFMIRFIKKSFLDEHYPDWKEWLEYKTTPLSDDVVRIIDGEDSYQHGLNPCEEKEVNNGEYPLDGNTMVFDFFKKFINKVEEENACVDSIGIPFFDDY